MSLCPWTVVSSSLPQKIRLFEYGTLEPGKEIKIMEGHTNGVTCVAVTQDGRHIVSGSKDHTVRIWQLASGKEIHQLEGHTRTVTSVAVTPDGHNIVSGSDDKTVRVWDLASGREIKILEGHTNQVMSVAVTHDGSHIVSGGDQNSSSMGHFRWKGDQEAGGPYSSCQ